MIDTLRKTVEKVSCFEDQEFALLTCHRPSNVDTKEGLSRLLEVCKNAPNKIIFPVHPRTRENMNKHGILPEFIKLKNLIMCEPMSYTDFLGHMKNAKFVITDSGGIQEETTALGVPCLTIRNNTERPVTIEVGTNILVKNTSDLSEHIEKINCGKFKSGKTPRYWDGKASERITDIILKMMS
jgi:UDP-N-acetylglucosamine 2-epimerase (non-hydrolysing)